MEKLQTKRRPSLEINAISNWLALGVNMVIGFILTPYLIKCLGANKYGIWLLIISVIGYSGLLDLGITSATMRYIARYVGQNDEKLLNETINTSLAIFCLIGLIVAIASLFAAAPLANFFHIETEDIDSFKKAIWLTGMTAGLMFPDKVFAVVILAHEQFVLANTIKIANIVLKGGVSILVLFKGGELVGLSLVFAVLSFFSLGVNFTIIKVFFRHIQFNFSTVNKLTGKLLISFGFFSLLAQVGVFLSSQLSLVIIGRFCELKMVSVYGVAVMVLGYLRRLVISCVGVTQPRLASLAGTVNRQDFVDSLMRYSILISNLVVGAGLVAYFLVKDFFFLWLPDNFPDLKSAYMVFLILLLSLAPALMGYILVNALQAINKHAYYAYQTMIEGVIVLIVSITLVGKYGVLGVAIGATIPSLLANVVLQPLYCARLFHFSWFRYYLDVLFKPLSLGCFLIVIVKICNLNWFVDSYFQLIIKGITLGLFYYICAYYYCFNCNIRNNAKLKLKRLTFSCQRIFRSGKV